MGNRFDYNTILLSLSPYSLLTYGAIFLVVRSETTRDNSVDNGHQSSDEQRLLGDFIEEGTLVRQLYACADATCDGSTTPEVDHLALPDLTEHLRSINEGVKPMISRVELTEEKFDSLFNEYANVLTPIVEKIPDVVCREHVRIFLHQLRRYKMWALQMYDSSAKLPSGILRGNLNQLGDFDQCLTVNVTMDADTEVRGKYCLASVDVNADVPGNVTDSLEEAVLLAQALGLLRSTVDDPGHFVPLFTSINWAVCLPSTCSADHLKMVLQEVLPQTAGIKFRLRVDETMCYVAEKKHTSNATYIAMFGFGSVIVLACVATVNEIYEKRQPRDKSYDSKLQRIVAAFSLQRNWSSLVADVPTDGDIHCIHGIRAICTIMLYGAHKSMTLALTPYSNRILLTEVSFGPLSMILRASLIYTDSFLLLSGVLTAYNLSKEVHRTQKIDWIKRYTARFIRLTPALLALVVFYAYILEHLGDGPMWNRMVKTNADLCKENMWTNILYIQNFFPFQSMCATHTHQLALDMQLSLVSPIIVYLLYKHPRTGVLVLVTLHAAMAALRFFVSLNNNLSLIIYHGIPMSQLYKTADLIYSLSVHRATPYLMGVGVGYFLYKYEKSCHIPKLAVYLGWILAACCAYVSVFAPSDVAGPHFVYNPLDAAVYAGYSSVTWSLALSWLICACALGRGGALATLLGAKVLVFTSRISYSMYLTQFAVFFYNLGSLRSSREFSLLHAVSLEELFVVLLVSITSTLLFDLPMQDLKAILTGSGVRSKITAKDQ